ncbi:ABC transporter ATP-binding protein [Ectothiorhodospira shaposhnikovii]|uniref:ABC transporter ATP-binding protein n=1 Tax=Ectothiorhodospira shaposhnikovii TaxID=1054 RepID=UPI001EE880B5|nr:ATP-binding cassette domain-containing protein [Ectothiorhodospira shaposhnikovii]MCG5512922.1 ATP-binding cassette domain-containing protein [Ectothiorhodospira shaposhnikovii]
MVSQSSAAVVSASGLVKSVHGPGGELGILKGVDLTVANAEVVAIVGASGSGKSTLLGLLAGLDLPTDGEVQLLGRSLGGLTEDQRAMLRAGQVGFVFQSFQLLPALTALENVMLTLELSGRAGDARAGAMEALEQVGLARRMAHYPGQLSGGEQQRVAIARAFAAHPRVLFADEPTGNLDQQTGEQIIRLLFNLKAVYGTALVLVTHDMALAARCERRYRLNDGVLEAA